MNDIDILMGVAAAITPRGWRYIKTKHGYVIIDGDMPFILQWSDKQVYLALYGSHNAYDKSVVFPLYDPGTVSKLKQFIERWR